MKKILFTVAASSLLVLGACSSDEGSQKDTDANVEVNENKQEEVKVTEQDVKIALLDFQIKLTDTIKQYNGFIKEYEALKGKYELAQENGEETDITEAQLEKAMAKAKASSTSISDAISKMAIDKNLSEYEKQLQGVISDFSESYAKKSDEYTNAESNHEESTALFISGTETIKTVYNEVGLMAPNIAKEIG